MLRSIPVVDKASDYRLWELIKKITWFHKILAWNKTFSFTVIVYQPHQANKQHCSIEVAIQASGNSKLSLTMFWKIAVSQPGLVSH